MARAKQPWRLLKGWHPSEWVAFKNVWQRAEKVIGSDLWHMQRDLRQEFVDGRLIMAVRFFASNGTETMAIILEPACWQWLRINDASSITGWEAIPDGRRPRTRRRRGIFVCAAANQTSSTPLLRQQVLLARPERRVRQVRSGRQVRKVRQARSGRQVRLAG